MSEQTQKNRDKLNTKIRLLGDKYYKTKAFFERLNIHRDNLFFLGKHLEEQFKQIKKGIHLQAQAKRMKEALYCWYAENFYKEIFESSPLFYEALNPVITIPEQKKVSKPKIEVVEEPQPTTNTFINQVILPEDMMEIQSQQVVNNYTPEDIENANISFLQNERGEDQLTSFDINDIFKEFDNSPQNETHFDYPDILYYEF